MRGGLEVLLDEEHLRKYISSLPVVHNYYGLNDMNDSKICFGKLFGGIHLAGEMIVSV